MTEKTKTYLYFVALAAMVLLRHPSCLAFVAPAYTDGELTTQDTLFKLVTGGFGALVIVLCGMGGFATLMITRQGKGGKGTPVLGVAMLLVAAVFFMYRVLIKSGFLGQEYLEY